MIDIFVGIDGGGSKCSIMVQDQDRRILYEGSINQPGNIASVPLQAWRNILELYNKAVLQIQEIHSINIKDTIKYKVHAGLGLAGISVINSKEIFEKSLKDSKLFFSYKLDNDVYIAYLGAFKGADGIIIITGTGSVGIRYEQGKQVVRYGGYGFPHADQGSLAYIGLNLTREFFSECGMILKNIDVPINLKDELVTSSSAYAALILSFLEHPQYYDSSSIDTYKALEDNYTAVGKLRFSQVVYGSDKVASLYAHFGIFILDLLNNNEIISQSISTKYDQALQSKIKEGAVSLMKQAASEINLIYEHLKKDNTFVVLHGGAKDILSKYVTEELSKMLIKPDIDIALQGACEMIAREVTTAKLVPSVMLSAFSNTSANQQKDNSVDAISQKSTHSKMAPQFTP